MLSNTPKPSLLAFASLPKASAVLRPTTSSVSRSSNLASRLPLTLATMSMPTVESRSWFFLSSGAIALLRPSATVTPFLTSSKFLPLGKIRIS